ncbi:Short-chain dehydrogenase/reductase SDR [Trinorchestia longiramus]|nr:Short-chain dehydrogenase/reductase SDR [Trinorchestia longiramus]
MSSVADVQRWQGKVAIVTGASAGIGAAICRSLVSMGMKVVGVARSLGKVQELSKELAGESGSLTAIQCDISKDGEVDRMFTEVLRLHGAVHCCINNAGINTNHSLLNGDPSVWRTILEVNVVGLCLLTKLAVNSMRENGIDDGHIIHINSTHGHRVHLRPETNFYAATKHAVTALTEGLRQELRAAESHIRVTVSFMKPPSLLFRHQFLPSRSGLISLQYI